VTLEVWNGVSGTLSGGNSATVLHTASADVNAWAGSTVDLLTGPAAGQSRVILANATTSTTLESTGTAPWGPLSPAPTVGPGDTYRITPKHKGSTRFTATVGGQASFVWGRERVCDGATRDWTANTRVEVSEIKYGSDATQTVVITRLAGAVTSFSIFPTYPGVVASIVANNLQVTMPADTCVEVTINGDLVNRVAINALPLEEAIPAGTQVVFDGSQTSVGAGQVLVVHAGCWIPSVQQFPVASTGAIYLKYGAVFCAAIDIRSSSTVKVTGPGVLMGDLINNTTGAMSAGTFTTTVSTTTGLGTHFANGYWSDGLITMTSGTNNGKSRKVTTQTATTINHDPFASANSPGDTFILRGGAPGVVSAPFSTGVLFCAIVGADASFSAPQFQTFGNVVSRISIVDPGLYDSFYGIHTLDRVLTNATWVGGTGSVVMAADYLTNSSMASRVHMFEDDDCLIMLENLQNYSVTDCWILHQENAVLRFGYWTDDFVTTGQRATVTNLKVRTVALRDTINGHFGSIVGDWTDGGASDSGKGRSGVTITGLRVEGPVSCCLWDLQNMLYPYGVQALANGQVKDFVFDSWTVDQTPSVLSIVNGKDAINTPHDLMWRNNTIGGVPLTRSNFATYVSVNSFVYNLWVNTVFQVETGTGLVDANAYCTVAYVDNYLNDHGAPASWFALSQGAKEQAIREATRFMDQTFNFVGRKYTKLQSLMWPRTGVEDAEGWAWAASELHPSLLEATALFASEVANGNPLIKNVLDGNPGVRSESGTLPGPLSSSKTYAGVKGTQPLYTLAIRTISYILDTSARDNLLRV
jgi:hypothetical protein